MNSLKSKLFLITVYLDITFLQEMEQENNIESL